MAAQVYYKNACCCDCSLEEGVGWISALEFTWGVVNAVIGISYLVVSSQAQNRLNDGYKNKNGTIDKNDKDWSKIWDDHKIGLIAVVILHCIEFIVAMLIMVGSSRRIRIILFTWIGTIAFVSLTEIIITFVDNFSLTYAMIGIIPLRLYFVFIVWSLAAEIKKYPDGVPVRRVMLQSAGGGIRQPMYAASPAIYSSPVIVPSYGYGYPYGGYGYGGYGAGGLGLGLGLGLGMGLGGGYGYGGYGGGYCGGYGGDFGGGYGGGYGGDFGGGSGYYDDNFF